MEQQQNKTFRKRMAGRRTLLMSFSLPVQKIKIDLPILKKIGEIANENEFEVYAVGGFVRDHYLGRPGKDIDFTVVGDGVRFAKKVAKQFKTKAVVYEKFKTAMVNTIDYKFEFVGTRKEIYTESTRKPKVSKGTLNDDLYRRDFTINTMAVALNKEKFGEVIDIFEGKKDLERRIIKTPLEPDLTFSDDPLRMMRAARFASQLEFKVDPKAIEAIIKMAGRIEIISQERITDELLKILASPKPSIGLNLLYDTGLFKYIFPEIDALAGIEIVQEGLKEFAHKDVFHHTVKVVDNVASQSNNLWLRFAALVHDIAKPKTKRFADGQGWTFHGHEEIGARWMERIFRKLKLPLENLPYVEKLVRLHQRPMALVDEGVTDSAIRRLAFNAGDALTDLFILCKADITTKNPNLSFKYLNNYARVAQKVMDVQERDQLREFQSPVRGDEIMKICNIPPSRTVGTIKSLIEEAILDGIIPNEYEAAKTYFLEHKNEWLVDNLGDEE